MANRGNSIVSQSIAISSFSWSSLKHVCKYKLSFKNCLKKKLMMFEANKAKGNEKERRGENTSNNVSIFYYS